MSDNDKKEFFEKYYRLWMTYLAAFPLENAEKILALLKNDQLEVKRGLKSIGYDEFSQKFTFSLNIDETMVYDYVINATGAGHDITNTDSELLRNLYDNQLITPHPLGGDIYFL